MHYHNILILQIINLSYPDPKLSQRELSYQADLERPLEECKRGKIGLALLILNFVHYKMILYYHFLLLNIIILLTRLVFFLLSPTSVDKLKIDSFLLKLSPSVLILFSLVDPRPSYPRATFSIL